MPIKNGYPNLHQKICERKGTCNMMSCAVIVKKIDIPVSSSANDSIDTLLFIPFLRDFIILCWIMN